MRSRSGVICPACGDDMANEIEGYKCDHCGYASKTPAPQKTR
jgi:ribosomal protein S27AE